MTKPTEATDLELRSEMAGGMTIAMPDSLTEALRRQGISPSDIEMPDVAMHMKIAWQNLCTLQTRDRKTLVSPICVVTLMDARPDAPQEFKDYRGMVRMEFTTEYGELYFATHAMYYADTGEMLPLWAWAQARKVPFAVRFAYIETRNAERHVVRSAPRDIELV